MSECKLDHSMKDMRNKDEALSPYLSGELKPLVEQFFNEEHSQDIWNDVFHLLKKYDLATEEEKTIRNKRLMIVLENT